MSRQTPLRTFVPLFFLTSFLLACHASADEPNTPNYVITKAEYSIIVGPKPATKPIKKREIKYAANIRTDANREFTSDINTELSANLLGLLTKSLEVPTYKKAWVSAIYHLYSLTTKRVEVPLLPPEIAVISAEVKRPSKGRSFFIDEARVGRSARGTVALLKGKSSISHEITLKFFLNIEKEGKVKWIRLPLVSSSILRIKLRLPETDLVIKTAPAAPIRIVKTDGLTEAEINPISSRRMNIEWYPRSLEGPIKPLIFVEESTLVYVSNGIFKRDVTFNYSIPRGAGEIDTFQILLPKKTNVLQVKGENILRWEIASPPEKKYATRAKIVKVILESGIKRGEDLKSRGKRRPLDERYTGVAYKLRLITEELTPTAPTTITFAPFKALGVNRQRGEIALLEDAGLSVKSLAATSAHQLDVNALDGATKARKKEAKIAYLYDNYDGLPVEISIRVETIKPRITAQIENHANMEAGVVTLTSRINYDIRDAGVYQLRVRFDDGLVPLNITGANMKDWSFENRIMTFRLTSRAIGKYTLFITSQQNLTKIDGVVIPRIEALDATTERGYIGVIAGRGVNLQHFSSEETRQIETSELPKWIRNMGAKLGYFYDQKGGSLAVSTLKIEPEVSAKIYDFVGIEDNIINREILVVCNVAKAGKFNFKLLLPRDVTPIAVRGANIKDWTFKQATRQSDRQAGLPTLWIDLRSEVRGRYQFEVVTERRIADIIQNIKLSAIKLADTKKTEGWLGVGPRTNIALRPKNEKRLTPLGTDKMPEFFNDYPEMSLGYTFGDEDWSVEFLTIMLEPKIEVKTFSLLSFRTGQMTAETEINYRISEASINCLWMQLPSYATNITIKGEGITETEKESNLPPEAGATKGKDNLWRVSLDRQRKGEYKLNVTWQMPLNKERLTYRGIKLFHVSRHTGYIVAGQERPDVEISEIDKGGQVDSLDPSEIPTDFSQRINIPVVKAYRYSTVPTITEKASTSDYALPAIEVTFQVTSHNIAEVTQTVAPECKIQTIVKREGKAISYLSCQLHNTNQQFLRVKLPKNSELWGTYISGDPVKPREELVDRGKERRYLIPILNSGKYGSDFSVGIIWRQLVSKPKVTGLGLKAPRFLNLNIDHIDWQVFMPEEYQILGYGGNLKMVGFRRGDVSLVALIKPFVIYLVILFITLLTIVILAVVIKLYIKHRRTVSGGVRRRTKPILISVLVVLAIIIVLAVMLLPHLEIAREEARITNMRTLAERSNNLKAIERQGMMQGATEKSARGKAGNLPISGGGIITASRKSEREQQEKPAKTFSEPQIQKYKAAAELARKQQKIVEKQRKLTAQTHYQLGNEYFSKGNYDSAVKEYEKALKLNPTLDQALRNRDKAQHLSRISKTKPLGERGKGMMLGKPAKPQRISEKAGAQEVGESLEDLDLGVLAKKYKPSVEQAPIKREYDIADLAKALGKGNIKEGRKKLAKMIQLSFGNVVEPTKAQRVAGHPVKGRRRKAKKEKRETEGKRRGAIIKGNKLVVTDSPEIQDQVERFLKNIKREQGEIRLAQARRFREEKYESRKRFTQRQRDIQTREIPRAVALNIIGGRASGALPILLELPTTGTVAYQFEKPIVGTARPEIRLHCIRKSAALFLQCMICLIVFAGVGVSAYKSRRLAMVIIIAAGIVLYVIAALSSSVLSEYFSVALYALVMSLAILAIYALQNLLQPLWISRQTPTRTDHAKELK